MENKHAARMTEIDTILGGIKKNVLKEVENKPPPEVIVKIVKDKITVDFGQSLSWVSFTPAQALALANTLINMAGTITAAIKK